ncbi:hypothetical protein [Actinoallomurus iriomotensis]|uniref:hypothetical protein n=1 Tax=Actinoallomurus iriomotensis TaxID=478107 RepID=UPI002556146F|nr:hypothetical protein [Actinoallomurus iriomotensis]
MRIEHPAGHEAGHHPDVPPVEGIAKCSGDGGYPEHLRRERDLVGGAITQCPVGENPGSREPAFSWSIEFQALPCNRDLPVVPGPPLIPGRVISVGTVLGAVPDLCEWGRALFVVCTAVFGGQRLPAVAAPQMRPRGAFVERRTSPSLLPGARG